MLQADADQSWKLVAANRPISVRDVFRHTTGYAYGGGDNAELERRYAAAGLKYRPPAAMMPPEMSIDSITGQISWAVPPLEPTFDFAFKIGAEGQDGGDPAVVAIDCHPRTRIPSISTESLA